MDSHEGEPDGEDFRLLPINGENGTADGVSASVSQFQTFADRSSDGRETGCERV